MRQAKAEAARQASESERRAAAANDEMAFKRIFSTVMEFSGKKYLAIDNTANRQQIYSFIHPGEQIRDAVEWFKRILVESPALANKLAWAPYLTPAQQVLQSKEDQKKLREQFDLACKTHGLVPNEANYSVWVSVPNPVISVFNGQPVIVLEDGTTLDLVPATQEQKDQWAEDARNKAFQAKQDRLRQMRDSNDLAGLRAEAARDFAERHSPQAVVTVQQQKVYKQLQDQYVKDSQAGFWEPLPQAFTKKVIYTWNAAEMRKQMSRYGASRITARIHDLTTIPDGNGGIISFEEKYNAANSTN